MYGVANVGSLHWGAGTWPTSAGQAELKKHGTGQGGGDPTLHFDMSSHQPLKQSFNRASQLGCTQGVPQEWPEQSFTTVLTGGPVVGAPPTPSVVVPPAAPATPPSGTIPSRASVVTAPQH